MKSQEEAQRTNKNVCNSSTSKSQFSFGREKRFKQNSRRNNMPDRFYDLPSQITKKGGTIARAKRDCQKVAQERAPSPGNYNPQVEANQPEVVFASGRDVLSDET